MILFKKKIDRFTNFWREVLPGKSYRNRFIRQFLIKYSEKDGEFIFPGMEYSAENNNRKIYQKSIIFPLKLVKFEDKMFFIPNDFNRYLHIRFGNYTSLPSNFGHSEHI